MSYSLSTFYTWTLASQGQLLVPCYFFKFLAHSWYPVKNVYMNEYIHPILNEHKLPGHVFLAERAIRAASLHHHTWGNQHIYQKKEQTTWGAVLEVHKERPKGQSNLRKPPGGRGAEARPWRMGRVRTSRTGSRWAQVVCGLASSPLLHQRCFISCLPSPEQCGPEVDTLQGLLRLTTHCDTLVRIYPVWAPGQARLLHSQSRLTSWSCEFPPT